MSRTVSKVRAATAVSAAALLSTIAFAPAAGAQSVEDPFGDITGSLGGPVPCDIDPAQVAADTPGPLPDDPDAKWTVGEHNDLGSNVGYLFLETEGGTGSSPTKVLLYHHCELTGTQTGDNNVRRVLGSSSQFHVSVGTMREPAEDESNAETGFDYTVYVWNPVANGMTGIDVPFGLEV
ncbi:MAG TPA: hypothetical protein K8V11_14595 [Dietzia timorensis]|uniref:Secreted protein n=1 Tax=Dietzia timorensis TaxID=499555 RepID=A0A921K0K0_9ACTN|nr:hypothetical protein [Dietzia timorensis]HJE92226.1 hypothetical protein [Dietzia timorensis]